MNNKTETIINLRIKYVRQSLAFSGVELEIETTKKLIKASGKRQESEV
jgi:hypothetical protein